MLTVDQERRLDALRDALPGQVLTGSDGSSLYPLRDRIGEGGQGWVFRATWNGSVDVVVKVLRPESEGRDALARFQREAQVLRTLSQQPRPNPHVVRFFDHAYANVQVASTGDTWTLPFTVMEYVSGITLEGALAREQPLGLGLERTRRVLRHVVLALKDVHAQNVVHRDLKPSNILIDATTSREIAKVTDFGLAKLVDGGVQRTTGLAGATVGYAPPEQFEKGNLRVGRATDVFSLAAIVYEMIAGVPAFPFGDNDHPLMVMYRILNETPPAFARVASRLPRELAERPDVVAALDAVLLRALAVDPAHRYPTVVELHDALEGGLTALGAAPSLPVLALRAGVSVSPGMAPAESSAPTLIADDQGELAVTMEAPPRIEHSRPPEAPSVAGDYVWSVVTPPSGPDGFEAIAVSPSGDVAIAAGRFGAARWSRAGWVGVGLPAEVDGRAMRAVAWIGQHAFWAGASPFAVAIGPDGGCAVWRFEGGDVTFHGAYADAAGVILAGERASGSVRVGVVGEIGFGHGQPTPRTFDVPGTTALRAVTRLGDAVLAAGDAGALAIVRERAAPRVVKACDPALRAVMPLGDGTAIAVGGGSFVFQVWPTLDLRLEAIQTTRDLACLARSPEGTLWCAGAGQRLLRREAAGWVRVAASSQEGEIRALHVTGERILAFVGDGTVLEGRRVSGASGGR